jgi:hypothetical protein
MKLDQLVNLPMNFHEATWHRQLCLIPDHAITDRTRAETLSIQDRISRVPKRRVKS